MRVSNDRFNNQRADSKLKPDILRSTARREASARKQAVFANNLLVASPTSRRKPADAL
jgi:hypothetical protein